MFDPVIQICFNYGLNSYAQTLDYQRTNDDPVQAQ